MDASDRFLKIVASIQELPQEFAEAILKKLPKDKVQKVVWIPPYEYPIVRMFWRITLPFNWRMTPPRAIVFAEKNILIAEKDEQKQVQVFAIPKEEIFHTEMAINLLYAYVFLSWKDGKEASSRRIEFNAVGEYSMRRQMDSLRSELSVSKVKHVDENDYRNIFVADPAAKAVPLKFQNYLIYSLVADEKVIAAVFQPEIRKGSHWLTGIQEPRRLVALTDRHILIIDEDRVVGANYSVITRFFPLAKVERIDFAPAKDNYINMIIFEDIHGCKEEVSIPMQVSGALWLRKSFMKTGIQVRDLIP